jgi:hypothetical protein
MCSITAGFSTALLSFWEVLKVLLNPAKSKHLILLSHLDKIPQSFFEFFGALSGPVNEGDWIYTLKIRNDPGTD